MDIFKIFAALGLGIAVLFGVQTAYVWSIKQAVRSQQASIPRPYVQPTPDFAANLKAGGVREAILPKVGAIDTRTGQRLAIENAARRVDLQIRAAQNAVPLPPRIHSGIPRR